MTIHCICCFIRHCHQVPQLLLLHFFEACMAPDAEVSAIYGPDRLAIALATFGHPTTLRVDVNQRKRFVTESPTILRCCHAVLKSRNFTPLLSIFVRHLTADSLHLNTGIMH